MNDIPDLRSYPILLIVLCALWAWVSITLVIRLWLAHRTPSFTKKFLWSLMLLVPVFGWMFYGAFFQVPGYHNIPASDSTPSDVGDGHV